jgi:hypothetical protein
MIKKKNLLSKLWLKHTDRAKYKAYKWDLVNYKQSQYINFLLGSEKLNNPDKIKAVADVKHSLNITHSGNAGDIIYALPTIKKIREITGAVINLYLIRDKPMNLPNYSTHPLGNVMLNQKMVDMLFPLLRQQDYISNCEVYTDQKIDIDLDYFRAGLVPQDKGNIARWCSYITGVSPDLWKQWLTAEPDTTFSNSIVVARSGRYQNKSISYSFISGYDNVFFIGVESEYKEIKKQIPPIKWVEVKDFLQLARIIAGCKFFIGNQSFPYSIAEALKVPRILEVSFEVINVVPEGPNGHDFLFQEHFEWLVKNLDDNKQDR